MIDIPYIHPMYDISGNASYVFDIGVLKNRIHTLRESLPGIDLCYAVKSNAFIVKELIGLVERIEICSPGEYGICRHLGVPAADMVISGVNKTEGYVRQVLTESPECVITIESEKHYEMIVQAAKELGIRPRALVRLTNDSQFGVNADEIVEMFRECSLAGSAIELVGVQYFSGTQKKSAKKIRREIRTCDELITRIKAETGSEVAELEYGGGFAIDYFEGDSIDESEIFAATNEAFASMENKTLFTLELGRSVAATCGTYYTNVADLKCNNGLNYAIVDGGLHQLNYDGQVMAMKIPHFHVVGKEDLDKDTEYTVCGSLCSMNDIIMKQASLPKLEIGDVIAFENAGAYSCMEGMAIFLSRDLPAIYLKYENGDVMQVRSPQETAALNTPDYK